MQSQNRWRAGFPLGQTVIPTFSVALVPCIERTVIDVQFFQGPAYAQLQSLWIPYAFDTMIYVPWIDSKGRTSDISP